MEQLSVFDIYKIGVGPSSSHTLGPWKAARAFINSLVEKEVTGIEVELFGSLSKTGIGHGTDIAVILGLMNFDPETIDTEQINFYLQQLKEQKTLSTSTQNISFSPNQNILFKSETLPFHPNALTFTAHLKNGAFQETYYSIGGGFIVKEGKEDTGIVDRQLPYPVNKGADLIQHIEATKLPIPKIVYQNELRFHPELEIRPRLLKIFRTMLECVYRGCNKTGILPGGLNVNRRAAKINQKLLGGATYDTPEAWITAIQKTGKDFNNINKWVCCFALAVNEENASFGRVVTSPTNGAAGVIPAVLLYHYCFGEYRGEKDLIEFLLVSGEIGCIFKKGATISAAMGGCQAEIGVSSAMAAAGLAQVQGATPDQVMMAAEIAMEHHLGLTCDPIGGLVQIPCIERNTMGAMKAITAANLAMDSDPSTAVVNLDVIVKTMWETAQDMNAKYKETAEGGLAKNIAIFVPNC
ncbi:MAG: L-serine ammonia-lyase [Bacteroidota bacterium]